MRTWLFFGAVLLIIAPACKTKHRASQEIEVRTEMREREACEAEAIRASTLDAVHHVLSIDSLHIVISDYRPDGSLARKTEIDRRRQTESRDSTRQADSLQASQRGQYELEATGDATFRGVTSTDAEPSLGVPWWLWVGLIIALAIVAWLYRAFGRR